MRKWKTTVKKRINNWKITARKRNEKVEDNNEKKRMRKWKTTVRKKE